MLRIVADANIPLVESATAGLGTVCTMPGREIDRAALAEADVLLVRSVTSVGRDLLRGTPVRFVGTATAGTDHIDAAALDALGVVWAAAPGSNAASVVDWVLAALLATAADRGESLAIRPDGTPRTLAIVGRGQVGGRLEMRARVLGLGVVVCDPPLARQAHRRGYSTEMYQPLAQALDGADIVSLHTPFTMGGPDATHHLLDADVLARLAPGAWVVNAARGRCLDGEALVAALDSGHVAEALLDVWPNEPAPHARLAERCRIATPHVAGYAADGKVRGTQTIARALRRWLERDGSDLARDIHHTALRKWTASHVFDAPRPDVVAPPAPAVADRLSPQTTAWLDAVARQGYDVRGDTARFRDAIPWTAPPDERATAFADLRRTYPLRREWSRLHLTGSVPAEPKFDLDYAVSGALDMGTDALPRRAGS